MDEITLTKIEMEEIKDELAFRVKTSVTLKVLTDKVDKLNGCMGIVKVLETKAAIFGWGFGVILIAIVTTAFKVFAR